MQVEPADHFVNWQQDAFGNFLARLVFPRRARSLTLTIGLIADLKVINPFDFFIEPYAEHIGFDYPKALAEGLKPYLRPVDEEGEGLEAVDEIEDIEAGTSPTLTVDLDAGSYVLICNITGHYDAGMHTALTVT